MSNDHFPLVKKSRKQTKDKPWITTALKKSSRVKNRLYKRWAQTGLKKDEMTYKHYKRHYTRISEEAERLYYQNLFNTKENSMKKLWNNLNTICSFKKKNNKFITKINVNNEDITDPSLMCNVFSKYFVILETR